MPGKGAYVMQDAAIQTQRNTKEQSLLYKNYLPLCTSLAGMANSLPVQAEYSGPEFTEFIGKPFRELVDAKMLPTFPKAQLMKATIEQPDATIIMEWAIKWNNIVERVIADYVHAFHLNKPGGLS